MPTLNWLGKDKVVNHHNDVPFRVLDPQYTFGDSGSRVTDHQNQIIHGDNLEALKALLPYYEGRIKCIYIDPPYNTGNENWVYNDNVNDPKIKRWLGKVVGKESEDLTRHDKWLCMMYPRLVLLHRLLADNGAIFVSIDDNEQASLKLMMDEIWGPGNFVANIIWQKKYSPQNDALYFSAMHDFIVCYAHKSSQWTRQLLPRSEKQDKAYRNLDNDPRGLWKASDLTRAEYRERDFYGITSPAGKTVFPAKGRSWSRPPEEIDRLRQDQRLWFGNKGDAIPSLKRFISEVKDGVVPTTIWFRDEVGDNQEAKQEVKKAFPNHNNPFDTPKPTRLIERVLQLATGPNDIILDSFAGSGTTAHAVLNLNKQDGGNRQFILVEMEEYAETITAERVRRVIDGYSNKEGTGGGFSYYELGPALFTEDNLLNEAVPLDRIREYIWYSETRSALSENESSATTDSPHFLGKLYETAYYFYYERNELTTLDYEFLATVQTIAEQYVIYADNCLIAHEWLQQRHIIFKKIPRDISRF